MKEIAAFFASITLFFSSAFQAIPTAIKNRVLSTTPPAASTSATPTASIDPTGTPISTPAPTSTPSPKPAAPIYTHSPDADLGTMGFTVEGGQNTINCDGSTCHLKVHGPFTITAYVKNAGTGMAANVPYVWYDNDVVIKRGVIDHLAPNVETSVRASFNSSSYSGLHKHRVEINPDKTLPEGTRAPNIGRNSWTVEPF